MTKLIVPNHVGYIIDGNRRWAKQHGLPSYEGHMAGYNAVMEVLLETLKKGVKYASVYAFSTENWKRSEDEVNKIMSLLLRILGNDLHILIENNVKLLVIGSIDGVSEKVIKSINNGIEQTKNNTGGTLAICFNYGGQTEIVDAIKNIIQSGAKSDDVTIDLVSQNIYASELPPVDIIVRTSGEQRISNFMLWRAAYSEMLFIEKLWPDMKKKDVAEIIKEYNNRFRRFGG